jgi:hypothetical protein
MNFDDVYKMMMFIKWDFNAVTKMGISWWFNNHHYDVYKWRYHGDIEL